MALTAGAKKFLVLVAVAGVLGGGYFYAKSSGLLDKKPEVASVEPEVKQEPSIPQPINSPVVQAERATKLVEQAKQEPTLTPAPEVNPEPREVPRKGDSVRKVERAPQHNDQSQDKAIKSLKSLNTL